MTAIPNEFRALYVEKDGDDVSVDFRTLRPEDLPPGEVTIGAILRAVEGPLAGVRGLRPEETRYAGAAERLPLLWVAVRAAVRDVVDEVSLADLVDGRMPDHVRRLTERPDAWAPR